MEQNFTLYRPDMGAFHPTMWTKPCFVCGIVAGTDEFPQHLVYEAE